MIARACRPAPTAMNVADVRCTRRHVASARKRGGFVHVERNHAPFAATAWGRSIGESGQYRRG
jgi:hypothetical protein